MDGERMTEKRYFKKMWEGEYYIFDSYTISEKDFDEKVEYEDYQAFADSMTGEEVTDRLNKYDKEYRGCHNDVLRLEKENEQLKNKLKFFNELNKPYGDIIKENEQLKQQIEELEFRLRTIEAYDRTVKEEHSDTVYDFKKKLEKW